MINPLSLFSISFLLSFGALLSIIFLYPIFNYYLSKIFSEKLASLVSISSSVGIGLLVLQLYYFGEISLLSIISNLITVPIASVLFIYFLPALIITFIFPIGNVLLDIFGFGMKFLVQFNNWILAKSLFLSATGLKFIAVVLSLLTMLIISDYIFVKRKTKFTIFILVLFATIGFIVF